ncbi:hypothetical protein [Massilia sp. TS11]|uniref:hypothetical protein n=1 Tax=Massilia sp. TS11 TaxID=2908003 RepID=UPI001EDBFDC4|nr:hypothetical protein [Massilia sp. TS11]MCG2586343.1 hypothetical protein [Massilia sp. TS11]
MPFLAGQLVSIRSLDEIRATLDADGRLDGLAFMPEMARFCGQPAWVHRRADYTCVEGHGLRRMDGAVFLAGLRCDGSAHDGCQRNCLLLWKEAWLSADSPGATRSDAAWLSQLPTRSGERYLCQSTSLLGATRPLSRWNPGPWLRAVARGELGLGRLLRIVLATLRTRFTPLEDSGVLRGTNPAPARGELGLRSGERVRVRTAAAIQQQLDPAGKNRGLAFIPSMQPWLGQECEVAFAPARIIHEQSGRMIALRATVVLKDVNCGGICVKDCPRASNLYWRESWLERLPQD